MLKPYLLVPQFMGLPFNSTAFTVVGSYVPGAEAVSQSQPCMTSYFKGGVESWRVAGPGQGSGWGLGLVPQAPCSSGHTASAPGLSPDTDLWDRGITIKPAVRTTQMVAQDDSRTNTNRHTYTTSHIQSHMRLFVPFCTEIHTFKQMRQTNILLSNMLNILI